jgi:hypothetical protein
MSEETPVAGVIGVGRRFSLVVPVEKLLGFASSVVVIGMVGIMLVIWPVWALYGMVLRNAPWLILALVGVAASWWLVWRPIRAYRKAAK